MRKPAERVMSPFSILIFLLVVCGFVPLTWAQQFSDREFQDLILRLSEEPGYFDTDNLISNESSYLHVIPTISRQAQKNQVYLGVGPDQNFTYISRSQPKLAFIIDIRRDNLLLQLYLKQLLEGAQTRLEFLSLLFGKPLPSRARGQDFKGVQALVAYFEALPKDQKFAEARIEANYLRLRQRFPAIIKEADRARLRQLVAEFFYKGLDLRFRSHGRGPNPLYPSFKELMIEVDQTEKAGHYLADREAFNRLRSLQKQNGVIPIVGDFAGSKAIRRTSDYLKDQQQTVSIFYVSNVELYLYQNRVFFEYLDNLKTLPFDEDTLIIRSYFSRRRLHPATEPGHFVASFAQRLNQMLELHKLVPYATYWDLVTRDYIAFSPETSRPAREKVSGP